MKLRPRRFSGDLRPLEAEEHVKSAQHLPNLHIETLSCLLNFWQFGREFQCAYACVDSTSQKLMEVTQWQSAGQRFGFHIPLHRV